MKTILVGLYALSLILGLAINAMATSYTIPSSSGGAEVKFDISGMNLIVTLTNISDADVTAPEQVLTGVFFNLAGNPTLDRGSATLNSGSTVLFGGTDPGGVVGGEWAYKSGLTGAPGGVSQN